MRVAAPGTKPEVERSWLSVEDVCQELGVSPSTVYKWSADGTGSGRFPRFCKLPNGSIRIRRDWLEDWLDGLAQRV